MYRLCSVFIKVGIKKIRITGGEPLVRKGIMDFFEMLNPHLSSQLEELTLTTNGTQLHKYASQLYANGVRRINISLDTLDPVKFKNITRIGNLQDVLSGIEAAKDANLKIKINCVALKNINDNEIDDFINFWKDKVDIIAIQRFVPPVPNEKGVAPEKYSKFYSSEQVNEKPIDEFKCVQPYQRVMIKNDKIGPCCVSFNKELILGSIHSTTIYDAWHSSKMKNIRKMHKEGKFYLDKTCSDCVNLIYPNNNISRPA